MAFRAFLIRGHYFYRFSTFQGWASLLGQGLPGFGADGRRSMGGDDSFRLAFAAILILKMIEVLSLSLGISQS